MWTFAQQSQWWLFNDFPVFGEHIGLGGKPAGDGAAGGGAHVEVGQAGHGAGHAKVKEGFGNAFDGSRAVWAENFAAAFVEADKHTFAVPT